MANNVNINITAKDKATGPIRKASRAVKDLGSEASKSGSKAKQDWGGLGDLFTGLLPRGLQSTLRGFKSAQRQIGRLSKGFKALKGAIAATGLGLLVVALGEIVANWDAISGAITKATDETEKQVEYAREQVELSQQQLDNISAQENILKLQGATEEDLLQMRMAATDEAIAAQRVQIDALKQQKEEQVAAAQAASDATAAILFMLTAPLGAALAAIDGISAGLVALGVLEEQTNLAKGFYEGAGDLLFDPDGIEESSNEAIEKAEEGLLKLENQRAGYQLRKNKMDEDAAAKDDAKRQRDADKAAADEEFRAAKLEAIRRDMELRAIEDEEQRAIRKREMQYQDAQAELRARGATADELLALEEQYNADVEAIESKYSDQRKAKAAQEAMERQALADELYEATLSDSEQEELRLQQLYDRRIAIAGDDEGLIKAATERFLADKAALEEKAADEEKERIENEQEAKRKLIEGTAMNTISVLQDINRIAGANQEKQSKKNFKTQQALAISETLISTYFAAQKAYASQFVPIPDPSSPVRGTIAAAAAVASGLAKVAAIKAQKYNSGSGGNPGGTSGPSRGGGAAAPGLAPPQRLASPDAMQAYVVESQLQGQQASTARRDEQVVL